MLARSRIRGKGWAGLRKHPAVVAIGKTPRFLKEADDFPRQASLRQKGRRLSVPTSRKYPRRESNTDLEFRKPSFYPLNYGGVWKRLDNGSAVRAQALPTLNRKTDAGGLVEGFLVLLFRIRVRHDTSPHLIDHPAPFADQGPDGDIE